MTHLSPEAERELRRLGKEWKRRAVGMWDESRTWPNKQTALVMVGRSDGFSEVADELTALLDKLKGAGDEGGTT